MAKINALFADHDVCYNLIDDEFVNLILFYHKRKLCQQIIPIRGNFFPIMFSFVSIIEGVFIMEENFQGIGDRIVQKMNELGISQKDIYSVTGFSKTTMSNYVNGRRVPNTIELYKLAKFFSVSMEWLLTGEETIAPKHKITLNENFAAAPAVNLAADDLEFLAKFHQLSDRQKGKIEGRIEEMLGGTTGGNQSKTSSNSTSGGRREEGATKQSAV